jgi:hypothetical protein
MPATSEHSSEYVGPASHRSPLSRVEGTLELPLALPDRPLDETARVSARTVYPERSPLLALGLGTGFACAMVALFWMWTTLVG